MSKLTPQQIAEKASSIMAADDHCASTLGISVTAIAPGAATVTMIVKSEYANGHGFCQGGIITTLADTAFAHACNSYNRLTVAQGLSIEFVRSAKIGEQLTAIAVEQSRGKLTGVYQVNVFNTENKLVAIMTGRAFDRHEPMFVE